MSDTHQIEAGPGGSLLARLLASPAGKQAAAEEALAALAERHRIAKLGADLDAQAAVENANFDKAHAKAQAARDSAHAAYLRADRHCRQQHADHAAQAWLRGAKIRDCELALQQSAAPALIAFIAELEHSIDEARRVGSYSIPVGKREMLIGSPPQIFVGNGPSLRDALDAAKAILEEARALLLQPDQSSAAAALEGLRARLPNFGALELVEFEIARPQFVRGEKK